MFPYTSIYIEIGIAIAIIVLLFSFIVFKSKRTRILKIRNDSLTCEELELHAKKTAIEHSVSRKQNLSGWPLPRMNDNYSYISSVYKDLNEDVRRKHSLAPAAEWLLDNFYIIEEQVKDIRNGLNKYDYSRLPVLKCGVLKGYARVFAVALDIIGHTDGQADESIILNYLKAYQSHGYLFDREIWAIPTFIRLALIEEIRQVCEKIKDTQTQWNKVDEILDEAMSNEDAGADSVMKLFKSGTKTMDGINSAFIDHLFYRLRRAGQGYIHVLKYIDDYLEKSGTAMESITQKEHNAQAVNTVSIGNCITSLKLVSALDWINILEAASHVEQVLREDPDGTYPMMDLNSRSYYRSRIEKLASGYQVSEFHIAKEAVKLAKAAYEQAKNVGANDIQVKRACHVGYYLIDNGVKDLEDRIDYKTKPVRKAADIVKHYPGTFYYGLMLIITAVLTAAAAYYSFMAAQSMKWIFAVLGCLAVLIPSSEIALCLTNWISCKIFKPAFFPRFEYKEGIPEEYSTMIAIPALLSDENRVAGLLENLESHYLANKGENLFFALVGDFKDSKHQNEPGDENIVSTALQGINELNRKYSNGKKDIFYFFHRERTFNEANEKWMGWERKRGALLEFNDLLLGKGNADFKYISSEAMPADIQYVITLDADTILPMGMARKMIGTMAHPLNRPVTDKKRGIVTKGYGLMQPRISFDIESSNRSLLSKIYTGQEGMDPYSSAVSDVYQDLFGEGIFTGKGIYDLNVFQSILKDAIPENTILSHDLLEGSYVRTGLVTDLELVDSYPSKYSSFISRLHRWIRGDWQLVPWLRARVTDRNNQKIKNPLPLLSRWKIFDNIRRSLVQPSILLLILAGFSILAGSSLLWLCFALAVIFVPLFTSIIDLVLSGRIGAGRVKRHLHVMSGVKSVFFQAILAFCFLPYQAYMMINAVTVTLLRVFVTKRNMLEWVTAADAERGQKNSVSSYWRKMYISSAMGLLVCILSILLKPGWFVYSIIPLVFWTASPQVAFYISREQEDKIPVLPEAGRMELRKIARKTYRYFEEFANFRNHYLIPDNFQEDPPRGIAYRTSPTNIGLGLLAILSARDMGYISTSEMAGLLENAVLTIERLDKWNGHLYNWYDTRTLKPLRPGYISTVDSGNFVCYLITLIQGLKEYLDAPLIDKAFIHGFMDIINILGRGGDESGFATGTLKEIEVKKTIDPVLWKSALNELSEYFNLSNARKISWESKGANAVKMFNNELADIMPWVNLLADIPDGLVNNQKYEKVLEQTKAIAEMLKENICLNGLPEHYMRAISMTDRLRGDLVAIDADISSIGWLETLKGLLAASVEHSQSLISRIKGLCERLSIISEEIKFLPLYVEKKQLFSIGYNIEENRLTNSFYDLFASEARQTSYIAIARGEVEPRHWGKLGRALTVLDGYKGLVSWTGTMFEYLMPLLLMKSFKNTLLDETYSFVIRSQKKYGKLRGMPWGASESGFNSLDVSLDYQYKAIGVPWLGLKRGLIQDAVAAPYATFLALLVDPVSAYENILMLKNEGLEGAYGYYEAVDYTPERLPFGEKRAIVKSYMAHHQGMSLLSLNNFLNSNAMQRRFHADPVVRAARLLLQEKVPSSVIITKESKEKVMPFKDAVYKEKGPIRKYTAPDPVLPKTHILSNGNYSIMITDKGTGFSRNKMATVTRWREDSVRDSYGMFFYLRNIESNSVWTSTYAPFNVMPEKYEVVFTQDKAMFRRRDGDIETMTEVITASGDNVEIRKVSLKNYGKTASTIDITSYFEVVLAPQSADVAHPAFSNLFIKTDFLHDRKCLVANRRPRSESDKSTWIANRVVADGEIIGDIQYETDRAQFIGRGNTAANPAAINRAKPLSNTVGAVLDPIMSIKIRIKAEPGKITKISFVTIVSEYEEPLLALVDKYSTVDSIEGAFRLALIRSQVEAKYLNRKAAEIELYQEMLSSIVFVSPVRRLYSERVAKNRKGQSSLWAYGISGDLPIVLVILKKTDETDILFEVLKAHEYWRLLGLNVDLVVLSDEENSYTNPLFGLLSDMVLSIYTNDILNKSGGVFLIDTNKMPDEDVDLLYAAARIILRGDAGSIAEQVKIKNKMHYPKKLEISKEASSFEKLEPNEEKLEYFNGLGGFGSNGNEYVIRLEKDQNTPAPWINVIANSKFGFIVSESGSGYTWYENSRENKLTPWSNDPVSDPPGEVLYIRDNETGRFWSPTPLPVRDENAYIVRHGFGYTAFEHNTMGIEQSLIQFVPVKESVKISIVKLRNFSEKARNISLFYYIRPVLGVSDQVTSMHIRTAFDETGALIIENPYNEEFKGKVSFITTEGEVSYTGDRKEFLGSGSIGTPDALRREKLSGTAGTGYDSCAALQVVINIPQGAAKEMVFLFGAADNYDEAKSIMLKYKDLDNAKKALEEAVKFWKDKIGTIKVHTPDASMDLMLNGWLMYQVISCRLWSRSAFYQSGGAFGFRDQLQDCLPLLSVWPEFPREQILYHARHQFVEGDVQHWWHEPLGKGTRTRFSDDLLWLPYVTAEYVRVTGDYTILDLETPYIEDEPLREFEDERYTAPTVSNTKGTVYEHCLRAIEKGLKFGKHGLPLMGSGDWNDGMSTVGNLGFGESVWLGWFICSVLESFSKICRKKNDDATADRYAEIRSKLASAIDENAWDGNWYRRAYFDSGIPLGSVNNSECKIDSIAQTWSVISGAGEPKKVLQAMCSLEDYLVQKEDCLIKLLTPPFDEGDLEPGYIKGYVPGVRENGGQYTHAAAWVIIAFAELGEGDKAWEFFELINPINHTRTFMEYSRYKAEPYVMAADVYAVHPHTGRGGWTWYTGSAGWVYRAGVEYLLGFRKNGDSVVMEPCIPKRWKEYEINYKFIDTAYKIKVKNPQGINKGVLSIALDGTKMQGNSFVLINDGSRHEVEVIMGK